MNPIYGLHEDGQFSFFSEFDEISGAKTRVSSRTISIHFGFAVFPGWKTCHLAMISGISWISFCDSKKLTSGKFTVQITIKQTIGHI